MNRSPTRSNFNRYPILCLAAAFAAGILLAELADIDLRVSIAGCSVLAIIAFFLRNREVATGLMLAVFVCGGAASAKLEKMNVSPNRLRVLYNEGSILSGGAVEVEGVLMGSPEASVDGSFLLLRAEKVTYRGTERMVSGNVRLFVPAGERSADEADPDQQLPQLDYGSRIRVACDLKREDEFLNPGVLSRMDVLDRLGVDATGSVKSPLLVEKIADESVFRPLAWVYEQRTRLIAEFRDDLGPSSAGIMIASLLGNKHFLDKETADLFREGGTFHILVISGLHITFIGGLLLLFLRQVTRNRWTQFILTMSILWAYTLAVGADVPVVRAAIMFTIVLYSYVIYRQGSLLNSLGVCALILLVWRPSDIFNPSFQLTFVSVAAIIAMAYPLIEALRKIGSWTPDASAPFPPNVPKCLVRFCETLYWNPAAWSIESKRQIWTANLFKTPYLPVRIAGVLQRAVRFLFEGILVSLVVQLWMMPLLVVYFHRVSVSSILLNLWVGFFIALESFTAVTAVLLGRVSELLAAPLFSLAEIINWLMLALPRLFSDNGWASFRLPAYSGYGMAVYVLYLVPILFFTVAVNRWKPFEFSQRPVLMSGRVLHAAALVLVVLLWTIVLHPLSASRPDGRLHIDFLDVGQGDSALVTFPNGETLLVDGGGRFRYESAKLSGAGDAEPFEPDVRGIGEAVVSEFLWHRGLSRIDHILATHADADHIQGLADVAKNFAVGSALLARSPMADPDFAALVGVMHRRGIPVETVARGERLVFGDVTVEVLYPVASDDPEAVYDNDHSLVLRIVMGSRAFLLTGDIERAAETALVNGGGNLTADLIKVPHHGSRTSSTPEFINAVGSKYAVVSVGRSSPFGHPHPDVIGRWSASNAKVMITGQTGLISVSTDGRDLQINTFVP